MELFTIVILPLVVSWYALKNRNPTAGIIAGGLWVLVIAYTRANPLTNLPAGSNGDQMLVLLCAAAGIVVFILSLVRSKQSGNGWTGDNEIGNLWKAIKEKGENYRGSHEESYQEYKTRMHDLIRGRK